MYDLFSFSSVQFIKLMAELKEIISKGWTCGRVTTAQRFAQFMSTGPEMMESERSKGAVTGTMLHRCQMTSSLLAQMQEDYVSQLPLPLSGNT